MKLQVEKVFINDIKKIEHSLKEKILSFSNFVENKNNFLDIFPYFDIKKLKWHNDYYRIRFWDYRLVFKYENNIITLLNFKHRKDIYKDL